MECPNCKSTSNTANYARPSVNFGVVNLYPRIDYYSCDDCGVMFKPVQKKENTWQGLIYELY